MSENAVALRGEWTIHAAAGLREALLGHLHQGVHTLDMQSVTEMDSAGLQLLLSMQRSLAMQGKELTLQAVSPAVNEVLRSYGLDLDLRQAASTEGGQT